LARQSIKQRVIEAVEALPADATIEDAMERLYFLAKIQRGLDQADAGDTLTHQEAKERLRSLRSPPHRTNRRSRRPA
jgi:predicted transcriptional regulator